MKPIYLSVLTLILAGVVSYATTKAVQPNASSDSAVSVEKVTTKKSDESVYDRVMRTGKIRCGYFFYNPAFMKDDKTGNYNGISHDILMEVANTLELDIEWVEEVSVAGAVTGLQTNRYDLVCSGLYERPNVMKQVEFIGPHYYVTVNAYVRPDDLRFDDNLTKINGPDYTVSSIDGTIPDIIWNESFPKAKRLSLPEMSPYSDNLLNVSTGKADVTFVENSVANEFIESNPESLRKLMPPVRIFPVVYYAKKEEMAFKEMLNSAIKHLHNSGKIEGIIQQYERRDGDYLRVAKPYEVSE